MLLRVSIGGILIETYGILAGLTFYEVLIILLFICEYKEIKNGDLKEERHNLKNIAVKIMIVFLSIVAIFTGVFAIKDNYLLQTDINSVVWNIIGNIVLIGYGITNFTSLILISRFKQSIYGEVMQPRRKVYCSNCSHTWYVKDSKENMHVTCPNCHKSTYTSFISLNTGI